MRTSIGAGRIIPVKIKVVDGLGDSKEFDLSGGIEDEGQSGFSFWIGRAKSCYIVIDDMSVSREHAQISHIDSKWIIKSDKKMLVNGVLKDEEELKHGDIITLGSHALSICDEDDSVKVTGLEEKAEEEGEDVVEEENDRMESLKEEDETEGEGEEEEGSQEEAQEEYHEEESFDSGYEMAQTDEDGKTQIVKGFSKIELDIFGEHAPYDTYIVEKGEVFIGRDPGKCEIVLSDQEVSGVHAVIRKSVVVLVLEDMNSANGTLLNGERINKKELASGDEFVIGSTTFTVRIESKFVEDEKLHLMPVEENQFVEVEEEVEVDESEMDGGPDENADGSLLGNLGSLLSKDALRDPEKRKKILYIVVGLLVVLIFLDEPEEKPKGPSPKTKEERSAKEERKKLSPEILASIDPIYQLALELFETGKYKETIFELDKIFLKVSDYKKSRVLHQAAKDALRELELMKKRERELKELVERKKKVKKLLVKAENAVKDRRVEFSEQLFAEIAQLEPENVDVVQLKIELEHYKKEEERKAVEKAAREAERRRQEKAMIPGRTLYAQKKWHLVILEFENLLEKEKTLDKDLRDEAGKMLSDARNNLDEIIRPILSKAKILAEGKDLKESV